MSAAIADYKCGHACFRLRLLLIDFLEKTFADIIYPDAAYHQG
jgi:hypothetical protein